MALQSVDAIQVENPWMLDHAVMWEQERGGRFFVMFMLFLYKLLSEQEYMKIAG